MTADRDGVWTPDRSDRLYYVREWGEEYFYVNQAGHVEVRPVRGSDLAVDLYSVVTQLREQGVRFPALVRFQDLLKSRVEHLNSSFRRAIEDAGYRGAYRGVYPIKVNQLREVVEEILDAGESFEYGLECGSKSELIATLPYLDSYDTLLICNGYKDRVMYRLMLAGQGLGKEVLPVVERFDEMQTLLEEASELDGSARFGVRVRLTTRGAGLWSESGGENSKFGLSLSELIYVVNNLRSGKWPLALDLLHFHLGSQIANVENVRQAVVEAARIYCWLRQEGIEVRYFDIGGGLGVSYEAGNPDLLGTINYSLEDYSDVVVRSIRDVCDSEEVDHPVIISESGRAVTAHHSVLIVEVLGSRIKDTRSQENSTPEDHELLQGLRDKQELIERKAPVSGPEALLELYGELESLRSRMSDLFQNGSFSVAQKASFERLYWSAAGPIAARIRVLNGSGAPSELASLDGQLADHYLCNMSVFRSMVDHWAIGQRFPIMPIHRLDEAPTRRGILVDLTCDSDGKVSRFVSPRGDKRHLELHELRDGEPYFLGVFLMGAYQDIMGDMHNLFGRVTEAHIYADETEPGNFYIEELLPGATVEEQLALVQYYPNDLERRMSALIQREVRAGRVRPTAGVRLLNEYRAAFREMTYLRSEA